MRSICTIQTLFLVLLSLCLQARLATAFKCYTFTRTVGPYCPLPAGCPTRTCDVWTSTTVTVPCEAQRCSSTPTVYTTKPCTSYPAGCPTICATQTVWDTTTKPCTSCYTATIKPNPTPECPPPGCIPPKCTATAFLTPPCPNTNCPRTPTITITPSCNPFCRGSCAVSTSTVSPTSCSRSY